MRVLLAAALFALAAAFLFVVLSLVALRPSHAGDPTGYWARESAAGRAPPKEWWDQLASGKGLCCSFADGERVEDVDWDTKLECGNLKDTNVTDCLVHYRVHLKGQWIEVPDEAVVDEPNRYGPAVVWPYMGPDGETQIRCFLAGAGT